MLRFFYSNTISKELDSLQKYDLQRARFFTEVRSRLFGSSGGGRQSHWEQSGLALRGPLL